MKDSHLVKIFLLISLLIFSSSCEKEDPLIEVENHTESMHHEVISLQQLMKIPAIENLLETEGLDNKYNLKTELEKNGLAIDLSRIVELKNGKFTTYTLAIQDEIPSHSKFRNLLIEIDSVSNIKTFIVEYTPKEKLNFSSLHDSFEFKGDVALIPIPFPGLTGWNKKLICYEIAIAFCNYGEEVHVAGEQCFANNNDGRIFTKIVTECSSDGGGTPSDPEPTDPEPIDWNTDGNNESGSDFDGGTTIPLFPYDDSSPAAFVISALGITDSEEIDYLEGNSILAGELEDLIRDNYSSVQSHSEAFLRLYYSMTPSKWVFKSGYFENKPELPYKATAIVGGGLMVLLENDMVLFASDIERKINPRESGGFASSEIEKDVYHYIYSGEMDKWFEYRMPPQNYANADLDFLFQGFWDVAKLFGRYAIPLEDAIILIDGKDFDGVEQSRATAGVLILFEITPAGKLIKITRKAGLALDAVAPVLLKSIDQIPYYKTQKVFVDRYLGIIANSSSIRKGNWSEMAVDLEWLSKGYKRIHTNPVINIDAPNGPGIDHIFLNEVTGEYFIVETKYHGSGGLRTLTDGTRQMSEAWITDKSMESTDRLWVSVGGNLNLYNEIIGNYQRIVGFVQADKTINYKFVSEIGYELNYFNN